MQSGLIFFPLDLMRMFYNTESWFEILNENSKDQTSFCKVGFDKKGKERIFLIFGQTYFISHNKAHKLAPIRETVTFPKIFIIPVQTDFKNIATCPLELSDHPDGHAL